MWKITCCVVVFLYSVLILIGNEAKAKIICALHGEGKVVVVISNIPINN